MAATAPDTPGRTVSREDEGAVWVCLCNTLTDAKIRQALADGARRPRDAYAACGCRARCGGCTRAILRLLRDARTTVIRPSLGA